QDLLIHIRKLLDVDAAHTGRVLTKLSSQRLGITKPGDAVQNGCGLARRKTGKRHIAFAPAFVRVMIAPEADDRGPPHLRLFAGRTLHQLDKHLGVRALSFVRERIDKRRNTYLSWFGFVFRHSSHRSQPQYANQAEAKKQPDELPDYHRPPA